MHIGFGGSQYAADSQAMSMCVYCIEDWWGISALIVHVIIGSDDRIYQDIVPHNADLPSLETHLN